MDFDSRYRGELIRYAAKTYGDDHVAQIVTFSTIKARAAVRDAARVLGYPYLVGDKIAKLMPPLIMGRDTPLAACLVETPKHEGGYKMATELRELYESDPDAKRVIDVARGLEGLRRQDGIHAAAVVITRDPLTEYVPVQRKPEPGGDLANAPIVTQYEMHGVEDLGLLKMDFLGLRNLDVLEVTLDLVAATTGVRPDIDQVPLDDEKTFEMLRKGDSIGVFQLEGGPVRSLLRSLAPTRFEDIAALVALYRPGPMAQNWHNEYADRKNNRKPVELPAPRPRRGPGADVRADDLPGAADARRAEAGRLLARRGRQPPQGDREEGSRPHREGAHEVRRRMRLPGPRPRVRRADLRHDRAVRRLLVQQVALGRLRPARVPDRLPEGELPGRVPRRAAHQREEQQGPDRGLPERVPHAQHRRARARRQRVGAGLHRARQRRRAQGDPLRPVRRPQRR